MRRNDRKAGSIKAFIVFALLAGNIIIALPRHRPAPSSPASEVERPRFAGRMHEAARFDEPLSALTNR